MNQKFAQEKELQAFINADTSLIKQYGKMLQNIDMVYDEFFADAKKFLVLDQVFTSATAFSVANQVLGLQKKIAEAKTENQDKVYQESKVTILKNAKDAYSTYVLATDKLLLKRILLDGLNLSAKEQFNIIKGMPSAKGTNWDELLSKHLDRIFLKSEFTEVDEIDEIFNLSVKDFLKFKDPMIDLAINARVEIDQMNTIRKDRTGRLNKLLADYVNVSILFKKSDFIPDANSTLRLTYGHVKGFTPVDATYMKPTTTLTGLIEKGTNEGDYYLPEIFRTLHQQKDYGQFTTKDGKDVPVAFLYNLDTTGGNSGSPIMDENGNLVGVNFDRAYEATINDFAWNDAYSRSIGCDIRYVLWVAQKVDHADFILTELGVKTIK